MVVSAAWFQSVFGRASVKMGQKDAADPDEFSIYEETAVTQLCDLCQRLSIDDGNLDTKTESGRRSFNAFLQGLEQTSNVLAVPVADRTYRFGFSMAYRALFPDQRRGYRIDVLEASIDALAVIWVNGDKFEFTDQAMQKADALQRAFAQTRDILIGQVNSPASGQRSISRLYLFKSLEKLDSAWATFEEQYINELMEIESKARNLIAVAIAHEEKLTKLEALYTWRAHELHELADYRHELEKLVASISRLNSVGNIRRKGRDDLSVNILLDAKAALCRCDILARASKSSDEVVAARVLALDVVESFEAMRNYLRHVSTCLEHVDPHLCNNSGLVSRLEDWEESWEVGARFLQDKELLSAICCVVKEVRSAQQLVPAFQSTCDDFDVEFFLALPRIFWLCFLDLPEQQAELMRTILPHRFSATKCTGMPRGVDNELKSFVQKFRELKQLVDPSLPFKAARAKSQHKATNPVDLWGVLLRRSVLGKDDAQNLYSELPQALQKCVEAAVDNLMHDLEAHSMELQRHCPEDWNQCTAIVVRCFSPDEGRRANFAAI